MIRNMLRAALLSWVMVSLPACATPGFFGLFAAKKQSVGSYYFDYQIYNGANVGLLQAFDDGRQTFLQFRDLDLKRAPDVWAEDASGSLRPARVEATMPYLVVGAVSRKVTLTFRHGETYQEVYIVRNGALPASSTDPEETPLAAGTTRDGGNATRPAVAGAARGPGRAPAARPDSMKGAKSPAATQAPERAADGLSAACDLGPLPSAGKTINVPFYANHAEPSKRAREELSSIAATLGSGAVIVKGRPSSGEDAALAQERGHAIKTMLVQAGVSPSRITVTTAGPKPGPVKDVFFSEILHSAPSMGFVVLDECAPAPHAAK